MAHATLTPEVRGVLERSSIENQKLTLPGMLDRKLYEAVNKVIVNCGGKWHRHMKCHVFDGDPSVMLGLAFETGVARDKKKDLQAFDTPKAIAERVVSIAEIQSGMTVLEPSAGLGNLATEARDAGAIVDCVELDQDRVRKLFKVPGLRHVYHMDFLKWVFPPRVRYDRVVMNPPFSKNQDIRHVEHALTFLRPGGRLVSVLCGNLGFRTDRLDKLKAVIGNRSFALFDVDAGAFKESGTNIKTHIALIE